MLVWVSLPPLGCRDSARKGLDLLIELTRELGVHCVSETRRSCVPFLVPPLSPRPLKIGCPFERLQLKLPHM